MQSANTIKTVEVYECSVCGSFHKKKEDCIECEKKCKAKLNAKEQHKASKAQLRSILDYPRLNAKSISELQTMIIESSEKVSVVLGVKVKKTVLDVRYTRRLITSHCTPIGVHYQDVKEKDLEFAGFSGSISFELEVVDTAKTQKYFFSGYPGSSVFDTTFNRHGISGIHTGTGGSNGKNDSNVRYRYDVTMFLDDFPLIKEEVEKYLKAKEERDAFVAEFDDSMDFVIAHDPIVTVMNTELRNIQDQIQNLQLQARDRMKELDEHTRTQYHKSSDAYVKSVDDYLEQSFPGYKTILKDI